MAVLREVMLCHRVFCKVVQAKSRQYYAYLPTVNKKKKSSHIFLLNCFRGLTLTWLDKRFITILPPAKNVINCCANFVGKNLDFVRVHGPTADEVNINYYAINDELRTEELSCLFYVHRFQCRW